MKNILLPMVILLALLLTTLAPQQGLAQTTLEKARQELLDAEAKHKQAQQNLKNAESKITSIQVQKNQTINEVKKIENNVVSIENEIQFVEEEINTLEIEINALVEEIENTYETLELLESQSKQTESDLEESKRLLQEAVERIESRNIVLSKRIQHMYTNGTVTYLEVLLGSTDFSDFLDRFNHMQSLVRYDKEILESNKRDYELVTIKIAEVEQQLAELVVLYEQQVEVKEQQMAAVDRHEEALGEQIAAKNQQQANKNQQLALKDTKTVQISNLNKEEEALAHYTEEQERAMIEAASKIAALDETIAFYQGDKLAYPLIIKARISSNFGIRTDPITGRQGAMHNGMDFAAPAGTDILAAEWGKVITAGWLGGYGNTVILDHGNGLWTLYAHARNGGIQVEVGDIVKRGQKISEVGTTGNSTGNHLHFEVRLNEKAVDPRDYLSL